MVFDSLSAFMEVLRALRAKTVGTYFLLALVYFGYPSVLVQGVSFFFKFNHNLLHS